jgi:hypothetical protein
VLLRDALDADGLDAGADRIHYDLQQRHHHRRRAVPSVAHHLAGLVPAGLRHPQPQKRPKSSWRRFQAELPNQC